MWMRVAAAVAKTCQEEDLPSNFTIAWFTNPSGSSKMTSQSEGESTNTSETARPRLEPCSKCGTRGPFEFAYIRQWLKVAHEDAVEAEGSASARHALFWVQQSVEKLYKAYFLMGDDVCYCEAVRRVGHDTLKSLLQLTEERIGNPVNRPDHLSLSRWSEIRRPILRPFKHLRRLIREERNRFVLIPPSELEEVVGILSSPEKIDEMVGEILQVLGFRIDEVLEYRMLHARLVVKMYLLLEITWAHQNSVRYPSHPAAANLSAQETAEQNVWMSGIGFNHYSDEIGAIYYVKDLARVTRETVEELLNPAS